MNDSASAPTGTDNETTTLSPVSANKLYSLAEDADVSLCILTHTLYGLCADGRVDAPDEWTATAARELTAVVDAAAELVRKAREVGLIDFELRDSRSTNAEAGA